MEEQVGKMLGDIPKPSTNNQEKAREEFIKIAKYLVFFASIFCCLCSFNTLRHLHIIGNGIIAVESQNKSCKKVPKEERKYTLPCNHDSPVNAEDPSRLPVHLMPLLVGRNSWERPSLLPRQHRPERRACQLPGNLMYCHDYVLYTLLQSPILSVHYGI